MFKDWGVEIAVVVTIAIVYAIAFIITRWHDEHFTFNDNVPSIPSFMFAVPGGFHCPQEGDYGQGPQRPYIPCTPGRA
jgi:hypothetical protein